MVAASCPLPGMVSGMIVAWVILSSATPRTAYRGGP